MKTRSCRWAALALAMLAGPAFAQSKDIVDTAVAAGSFKTLAKLLTDADLIGVMKGPDVLKYHVLTSKWTTDDFKLVKQTGTAQGKPVTFVVTGGGVEVNGAKVVKANIDCANGMVHAIDTVLLPPQ
jgi:uncharacterized surface protein with fasciclin (FAS1) repeats